MRSTEVPKGAIIGIAVVLALIIGYFAFKTFVQAPAQVDPSKIPADRLLDPDRRGPKTP